MFELPEGQVAVHNRVPASLPNESTVELEEQRVEESTVPPASLEGAGIGASGDISASAGIGETPEVALSSSVIAIPEGAAAEYSLRDWIRDHDEKWLFVGIYLGLAVVLSVFVSLFWLVLIAVLHFGLECIRQARYREGGKEVTLHALWEVKLDVALVLLALTLVLYIDVVLGVLGIQSAARAGAITRASVRLGSRAAAWERNIRTFLLTIDEVLRVGQAAVMFRKKKKSAKVGGISTGEAAAPALPERYAPAADLAWRGSWKLGDRVSMTLLVLGTILMLAAPLLTHHDWAGAITILMEELQPFPSSEGT